MTPADVDALTRKKLRTVFHEEPTPGHATSFEVCFAAGACFNAARAVRFVVARVEQDMRQKIERRILNTVDPAGQGVDVRIACVAVVRGENSR